MERVILESPYAAKSSEGIALNEMYAEFCMHDMIVNHNESPYASHLLYTRPNVLRDDVPQERKLGIKAGFFWRDVAERTAFYCDLGMTDGMEQGFKDVQKKGRYEMRWLPDDLWKSFKNVAKIKGMIVPERVKKI
jgi:hypothetical protein